MFVWQTITILVVISLAVGLGVAIALFGRPVFCFIFGIDRGTPTTFGNQQAYSTLTWLLGIIMTQGATFAASLQFNGNPFVPILAYACVSLLMLVGVSLLLRVRSAPRSQEREFDYGTIVFGRWVQTTLIILAVASITASLFGALPGQSRTRKPFSQDILQCEAQGANNLRIAGPLFGVASTRNQLDEASLNRWRTWIGGTKIGSDQRLLYVQTEPFDADYLSFQVLIDFDNLSVAFEDAFVILVQNSPVNSVTPPIYRLLGNPVMPPDIGSSSAKHLPLPLTRTSAHLPVFNVPAPNKGDVIVLFVLVKASDQNQKLPDKGDERSMFLKLKRVN